MMSEKYEFLYYESIALLYITLSVTICSFNVFENDEFDRCHFYHLRSSLFHLTPYNALIFYLLGFIYTNIYNSRRNKQL